MAHSIGNATGSAWAQSTAEVLSALAVDPDRGLDESDATRRRQRWGANALPSVNGRHVLSILSDQFRSVVIFLLIAAGTLAIVFSEYAEGVAIYVVVILNCAIGFVTEWRAVRSMEALRQLARVDAVVVRDGVVKTVGAWALVPGDVVVLEAGDIVPADLRLIGVAKLQANESTLTGESLPVAKRTDSGNLDDRILERNNMVFKGSSIVRGSGRGVVVATGLLTEFGRIYTQVSGAESHQTPLEMRLDKLGQRLAWAAIVVAVAIALIGILSGRELLLAVEVAVALAVAAIPEGLPIVATIALARGMWRMAQQNALITRLSAVETLGATSVILTDKTGTLTENHMLLTHLLLDSGDVRLLASDDHLSGDFRVNDNSMDPKTAGVVDELLKASVRCSNATLQRNADGDVRTTGDPTEIALLFAAANRDIWRDGILKEMREVSEEPFDPDTKRMATVHRTDDTFLLSVKGAPEAVIEHCSTVRTIDGNTMLSAEGRDKWFERASDLGRRGLRTLAVASRIVSDPDEYAFADLVLLGVVGLEDPARQGVGDAITLCHDAGIQVVMVTGDHAATASNVAVLTKIVEEGSSHELSVDGAELDQRLLHANGRHLLDTRIFSRVTPEQKLNLIGFYQNRGHIVAMTGDGVNDAPALKKADIGIAMGIRGTAVAKEAASMVLQDDEFGTIVDAVSQGRAIFQNIRKFVLYLMSCNISEILIVSLATIAGGPLPLLPLQILFLNLVTDVFPALALGVGQGSDDLMSSKPKAAGRTDIDPEALGFDRRTRTGNFTDRPVGNGCGGSVSRPWTGQSSNNRILHTGACADVARVQHARNSGSLD